MNDRTQAWLSNLGTAGLLAWGALALLPVDGSRGALPSLGPASARAQTFDATAVIRRNPTPNEFGIYWATWAANRAWYQLDMTGVPWNLHLVNIPGTWESPYKPKGPHHIDRYPGGRTAYYQRLGESLQHATRVVAPSASYDGLICIDMEYWTPNWTGHMNQPSSDPDIMAEDHDVVDDWREHITQTRPQLLAGLDAAGREEVFRQTWLAETREFFTFVYTTVKTMRPQAKVGFYNMPVQMYFQWRDPVMRDKLRFGYEVEAAWFWEMVDFVAPSIYTFYTSIPDGTTRQQYQDTYSEYDAYVRAMMEQSLRVARGKPIYAWLNYQYHPSNPGRANTPVSDYNMRRPFEICREMGASGVIIFGWFLQQSHYDAAAPFFRDTYSPFLRQFATQPSLASTLNPPPLSAPSAPTNPDDTGNTGGNAGGGSNPPADPNPPAPPAPPPVPPELNQGPTPVFPETPGNGSIIGEAPAPILPDAQWQPTDPLASGGGGGGGGEGAAAGGGGGGGGGGARGGSGGTAISTAGATATDISSAVQSVRNDSAPGAAAPPVVYGPGFAASSTRFSTDPAITSATDAEFRFVAGALSKPGEQSPAPSAALAGIRSRSDVSSALSRSAWLARAIGQSRQAIPAPTSQPALPETVITTVPTGND